MPEALIEQFPARTSAPARVYAFPVAPRPIPELMLDYVQRLHLTELEEARLFRELRAGGLPLELPQMWAKLEATLGADSPPGQEWRGRLPAVYRTNARASAALFVRKPIQRTPMSSKPFDRFYAENWVRRRLGLRLRHAFAFSA